MDYIWKSDILRRTSWFMRTHCNWPVKRSCTYTYIHTCLVYLHSWGNWVVLFWSIDPNYYSCELHYTNLVENIHWTRLLWNSFMNSLVWLYMLCAYMWLVIVYVMCIYVVGDYICFMCIYVVGDYICLCAYMLLVNFRTCYWCWFVGVSMYWNMLVWICGICMKYVLLLLDFISMLVVNTYVFNYAGWLWCVCCIRGDGLGDEIGTSRI